MIYSDIEQIFDNGNVELIANLVDGSVMNLRLFKDRFGDIGYFDKGSSRHGRHLKYLVDQIESVKVKKSKQSNKLSGFDREIDNLKKMKKIFTKKLHPNLWSNYRDGYTRLDIDEFIAFYNSDENRNDRFSYVLDKYRDDHNLHIINENNYKLTTIKSNPPKYWISGYNDCLANIKNHLDNKEQFGYYWKSNYDVSVHGKLDKDGIYKALLSLEYRGRGNGHYYLLINENQAVFIEDD